MDREQLKDVVVLSEVLSFSEAADQLFLTQSALSKRVKALEKELRAPLFIRDTRNIKLSPFGKEFLPYARQILTSYESADLFLQKYRTEHRPSIALGSIRNPQSYGIDRIFFTFREAHPDIRLNLYEEGLSELVQLFRQHKINLFCTCSIIPPEKDAEFIPVGQGYLVAVMPAEHPDEIDYETENLLLPAQDDTFCDLIVKKLTEEGHHPSVVYNGGAAGCVSLVRSRIGVAIMPVEVARDYREDTVKVVRVFPEVTYDFGLGYRKETLLSKPERTFVKHLKDHYEITT